MKKLVLIVAAMVAGAVLFAGGMAVASTRGRVASSGVRVVRPSIPSQVFHPMTPCRIVDTRKAGGALTNAQRTFVVPNTGPQGGDPCPIPTSAGALAMNVTAISANGKGGYVRGWPAGATAPNATLVNFAPSANLSNMVDLAVSSSGFTMRSYGSTHLVIDVVGYYLPQIHAVLGGGSGLASGSPLVTSYAALGTGQYQVTTAIDVTGCTPVATTQGQYLANASTSGSHVNIYVTNLSGALVNTPVNLSVLC